MAKKYDKLRKYIISMTRAKFKLRTVQTTVSDSQRIHNLKGKFEGDETRAAEDVAVFEYLGLKLHSSSEMLFSKSLYQKIRKQLSSHKKKYKSLAQVTIDFCKGLLTVEGKHQTELLDIVMKWSLLNQRTIKYLSMTDTLKTSASTNYQRRD